MDIRHLKRHGISSGNYKTIFDQKDDSDYPKPVKKLIDLVADRNRDGISLSLKEWRAWAAIDIACEVPFNQTTPTLVHNILSKNLNRDQTLEALADWGLSADTLFMDVTGSDGKICKAPNAPVFFQIFIPIVKAYVMTVLAQIYNERNTSPLLPYNPLKQTTRNRFLCEIVTDLMETTSTWLGYAAVLKQSIHQMLKYGTMIAFPREEWYCEQQIREDGTDKGERYTVKEGLRYTHPHPSKLFYDMKHPLTTLNTDTGTEYIGYWHIMSYGEILDNRLLWNRKNIFAGTNWFQHPGVGNYFSEIYPCTAAFPAAHYKAGDREDRAAWYNPGNRDQSVFVCEHFCKIVPRTFGLGRYENKKLVDSYDYPVWHRLTMAGDDTPIWVEPNAYCPGWFMGYDYDEQAAMCSSLGLELIPFQDHLGNILSQMHLTAKQNLLNVNFYDTNIVDKADIDRMNNLGEAKYRSVNWIGFDSMKRRMAQTDINRAFIPVQLAKSPIGELLQLFSTSLSIMERVLSITSQETGSAASHQQSKEEVVRTGAASANRKALTSAGVDEGIDAWKRQWYAGFQQYGDPSITVQVSSDIDNVEEHIEELGFKVKHRGEDKLVIEGHKKVLLRLEEFARAGEGPLQGADKEIAAVIFQLCGTISGQPELFKQVGAKTILTLLEEAAKMAGARKDLSLKIEKKDQNGEVPQAVIDLLKQVQGTILKEVETKVAQPAAQQAAKDGQAIQQLQQAVEQLKKIYQVAAAEQEKAAIKEKEVSASIHRKDVIAAKDQTRKDLALSREERRRQEKHALDLKIESEKAATELALEAAKTKGMVEIKKAEAAAKPKPPPKSAT